MKKAIVRLSMFFLGLPAVLALIIALPQPKHLAADIAVIVVCSLGAIELARILNPKGTLAFHVEAGILGAVFPLSFTLSSFFPNVFPFDYALPSAALIWILSSKIFTTTPKLESIRENVFSSMAAFLYPGSLLAWIIKMTSFAFATEVIVVYLLCVFGNDSLAWLIGMLFGKNNRGIIAVSPNKSIAGFVGGIAGSLLITILAPIIVPHAFRSSLFPPIAGGVILGFCVGFMAIIGDLAESALKRSVNAKDSGTIIPGRGGILDSVDSLAFAAPVFFILYHILFTQ